MTQLPTIRPIIFLQDPRSGKPKQICVLVAKDYYDADNWWAVMWAEDEQFFSIFFNGRKDDRWEDLDWAVHVHILESLELF